MAPVFVIPKESLCDALKGCATRIVLRYSVVTNRVQQRVNGLQNSFYQVFYSYPPIKTISVAICVRSDRECNNIASPSELL